MRTFSFVRAQWLPAAFALTLLAAHPASSQKIAEHKIWSTFHKAASAPIDAKYKSYSVEYDLGRPLLYLPAPPALQGLEYKKTGGDLTLVIRHKGFATQPEQVEKRNIIGGDTHEQFYCPIAYSGTSSYELLDKQNNHVLQHFEQNQGTERSPEFNYRWDLDLYLRNACTEELSKKRLQALRDRINYTMVDHNWTVRLGVNAVEGEMPAYQEISKAATEFEKAITEPTLDKNKLLPLVATWEAQLAKADWTNKKAEINRKVANALLGNLCSAYMLLEDYGKLQEKAALYTTKNSGLLEVMGNEDPPAITFEIEKAYTGPIYQIAELTKDNVTANYYVVKYSGALAGPGK
ncbi:hypothetical protein [Hymenobacter negativus]|uniref:Uncharacterized protein n=1 Tax=Hymenobacter negativus TaxID=2795026 RepID=A0ABS3QJE4_9BACT|nr:hypothetical protein [Hymenobacter negativus]MBO2011371.1 hypothetical protein [Hymenobacter negativus]